MEEPLNLTVKKMPIAIVAPFTVVDNKNNNKTPLHIQVHANKNEDVPEDLSMKSKYDKESSSNYSKNELSYWEKSEQLKNILNRDESRNRFNKNTFREKEIILNDDVNKPRNFATKNFSAATEYMATTYAEHKFLTTWYMNSLFDANRNPYLNFLQQGSTAMRGTSPYEVKINSPENNRILNNLLEKKSHPSYKFPVDFDALIKNEMPAKQPEEVRVDLD
ncbi:hypothetical protein HHI36_020648, partial [Cryptolaemus montrouzieri]